MKYISPTQWSHRSIERFRGELDKVQHMVDYWEAEYKNIAFGELEDGRFSYKEWAAIFESKGWKEDLFNLCYYKPASFNIQKETVIITNFLFIVSLCLG